MFIVNPFFMSSYLFRTAFLITLFALPFLGVSQKIAKEGMESKPLNFQTFSIDPAGLPYNAPCGDCTEDVTARTEYSRTFRGKGSKSGLVYSQAGYTPIHIRNDVGEWISVDARLKPAGNGKYEAKSQHFPTQIDLSKGSSIKNPLGEIWFNNRPELIWKKNDGTEHSLGKANFSNHTAGDDGVIISEAWPGIDIEMRVLLGGIKTNFIVKQRPQQRDGFFIIRDEFQLTRGLGLSLNEEGATIQTVNGIEAYTISKCIGYDNHSYRANESQTFEYELNNNILDIIVPISVLQDPRMVYPYTIDPLVNSSNTLAQASITGSAYSSTCFSAYCPYNMNVPSPANAVIVDALWSFTYVAAGSCWRWDGAVTFHTGACNSPNQAGYYWFCNGIGTGTCTGNNISIFSDVGGCMPAPSCAPQNIPFQMRFYRCYSNSAGCSNTCIGAGSPWTMTLVGQTVEVASASVNGSSSTTICQGTSATLNATGTFGVPPYTYTWNPGGLNGASVNVSPSTSTTYTLTVTDACSQTSNANVTVNVTPQPATPSINSNSPICAGQTLNLSTPSAGNYYWTGPNGFTSTIQNPSIPSASAANAGTYNLYIIQSGCSSVVATHNVVINPVPATPVAGGNSPICEGEALNLTGSGGSNYFWTGPNSFTSSTQNPVINPANTSHSGNYSLASIAAGCTSAVANYNVVVNSTPATPAPGSNSPVCVNSTLNLTSPASSGTYVWSGPNGFASNAQNPSIPNVTSANNGTYSLYIVENGCTSATGTVSVTVVNPPITPSFTTNSPVCEGGTITLTGSVYPFVTYVWNGPNGFSGSGQSVSIPNVTIANAGNYSLALAASGCTSTATVHAVVVNPSPAAPTVGGNSPICDGASLDLTSSGAGGGTYYWTGPNAFTSTTQNPVINPATATNAGTYSGYYILIGCTSAASTYNVVINPIPAAPLASSNSPVCVGNPINLSTTTSTTGTYVWTGPNSYSSNVQNPTIAVATAANNGTYNLSIVENGCTSAVASVAVSVINPPVTPSFTTNSPVCEGGTITLTGTPLPIVTYVWSGPNGYSATGQVVNIPNATVANAGNYSLSLAASGCTSTATVQAVVVNPLPAAPTVGGNSPVCVGNTLNLTASPSGAGTFYWTGPNSYTSTTQNPSISNVTTANAGTYSAYYIVNGCTSLASTYNVVINPLPAIPSPTSNSPVCVGNTIQLNVPNVPNASYSWSGPNSYTSPNQNPNITSSTLNMGGTYTVTVTVNGCSSQGTVSVSVVPPPTLPVINTNSPVCDGGQLNLGTSSTATDYVWSGPGGWSSSQQNPAVNPFSAANAGTYTLYIVAGGCTSATANAQVALAPSPQVLYNGPTQVCGSEVNLSAIANIAAPATISSITWNAPTAIGTGSTLTHNFGQVPATVNVSIVAVSSDNCSTTANVTLNLADIPVAQFSYTQACDGESIQFTEQHDWQGNETATPNFNWQYNSATFSTAANPTHNFGGPGTYNVTLVVTNATSTACTNTITQQVTVYALPSIDFTYEAECIKDVVFVGTANPDSTASAFVWDFGDGGTGNGANTTHAFTQQGLYNVELSVTTNQGCTVSITKPVQIDNASAQAPPIPNIITPNGDLVNDVIDLEPMMGVCGEYEFTIFSRWGNVVFIQKTGGAPFVGKNTLGAWLTPGVYFYMLNFNDQKTTGTITVNR